jgi:hypothetical protein
VIGFVIKQKMTKTEATLKGPEEVEEVNEEVVEEVAEDEDDDQIEAPRP